MRSVIDMMKRGCTFFSMLISFPLWAQDLTGTWEGTGGAGAPYMQLVIARVGDDYIGYTYDIDRTGYCKANFIAKFESDSKKLKGKGTDFIERTLNHVLCVYNLTYSYREGVHYLTGTSHNKAAPLRILDMNPGYVRLTRISTSVDTTDFIRQQYSRLDNKVVTPVDTAVNKPFTPINAEEKIVTMKNERRTDTLMEIGTTEKKFLLKIFDNGITDGDSISILYNGKLIVPHLAVTGKVMEFPLTIENNQAYHSITLVAHNLGTIPPNTATVVIETNNKKYTLNSSVDLQKNNAIIIRYNPSRLE